MHRLFYLNQPQATPPITVLLIKLLDSKISDSYLFITKKISLNTEYSDVMTTRDRLLCNFYINNLVEYVLLMSALSECFCFCPCYVFPSVTFSSVVIG